MCIKCCCFVESLSTIDPEIQTSFDVPSDFPDGKMPYLDTKQWMEYNDEKYPQGKLLHQHFVKPMATRIVVEKESAIGEREKRTIHTQEIIRIFRNCHEDLPQEQVNKLIEDYIKNCKTQALTNNIEKKF